MPTRISVVLCSGKILFYQAFHGSNLVLRHAKKCALGDISSVNNVDKKKRIKYVILENSVMISGVQTFVAAMQQLVAAEKLR